ncbi:MAG: hypothetical protein HZY76_03505 [Anaerolineae bacterium]|nr:MAG: hypothetical protein HZY76_03505 [Anaerolineae bacterium]
MVWRATTPAAWFRRRSNCWTGRRSGFRWWRGRCRRPAQPCPDLAGAFFDRNGQVDAAFERLHQALALAGQGRTLKHAGRRRACWALLPHRGQFDLAQRCLAEASAAFRDRDDRRRLATALTRLGIVQWRHGDYGAAQASLHEAQGLQEGCTTVWAWRKSCARWAASPSSRNGWTRR